MKVVTSVNEAYLGLLDVWLRQSSPVFGMPATVCCMDDAARDYCDANGIAALISPRANDDTGRGAFWLRRFDLLAGALEVADMVHSDVDAFWLRPPSPMFERFPDDLIFSREFGIPRHVVKRWGFVLCCGFFLARSTDGTRAFFARWREATRRRLDDQWALNELLHDLGAAWTPVDEGGRIAHRCTITVDGQRVSVLVLSHDTVTRDPPYAAADALVAHPYFERQFFRSYVELLLGLFEESGSVMGPSDLAIGPMPAGVKRRDVATFHALRWLLERRPANAANWAHLGALQIRLGDSGAAAAFRRAQDLGAADNWSVFLVGTGLAALGQRAEAVTTLSGLAGRGDLEFDLSRRAAGTLARLGAWPDAARLAARAGRTAGLAGGMAMTGRLLRRTFPGIG
jgi:hypothetical protein